MSDTQDQSAAQRLPLSKQSWHYLVAEAGFLAATCVSVSLAVPIMYAERFNDLIWGSSILAFAGLPVLVGIARGKPSFPANLIAGMLLLACPIVYALADSLPVRFELLRDAFFLATGSTLTFISTGWTASFMRSHQWSRMCASVMLTILSVGSIAVMVTIFMYLE